MYINTNAYLDIYIHDYSHDIPQLPNSLLFALAVRRPLAQVPSVPSVPPSRRPSSRSNAPLPRARFGEPRMLAKARSSWLGDEKKNGEEWAQSIVVDDG